MSVTSTVARLLATENLEIEYGSFKTASFDIQNRVLKLPTWTFTNCDIVDLMTSHEVGHALFTSAEAVKAFKDRYPDIPFSLYNILEDIRIEKLIQRKYPGLIRSYDAGYRNLWSSGFFGKPETLMDRMNVQGKCRHLSIIHDAEEKRLFQLADSTETENDVLTVCEQFVEHVRSQKEPPPLPPNQTSQPQSETEDCNEETETDQNVSDSDEDSDEDFGDLEAPSQEQFDEQVKDKTDNRVFDKRNLDVFSYEQLSRFRRLDGIRTRNSFDSYETRVKRAANMLAKQFLLKKAAYRNARATESKSGALNSSALWRYKLDEEIFASNTSIPDDISHGIFILVDYSQSMSLILDAVIEQTLNLVYFCKSVNVPFVVYGFTGNRCFELVSSRLNKPAFYRAVYAMFCSINDKGCYTPVSSVEILSSTPLNLTMLKLDDQVGEFKRKYSIQKLTYVTLTDGASVPATILTDAYGRSYSIPHKREIIKVHGNETASIIEYLRNKHQCKFVNYFISQMSHELGQLFSINRASAVDSSKADKAVYNQSMREEAKKAGFLSFTNFCGYDLLTYINSPKELEIDDEDFDSQDRSTAKGLKSLFVRHFTSTVTQRKIMVDIGNLIA